jgi:hypothetical protein
MKKKIKNQYSNQKNHSQVCHLKQEITKISQESQDVPELVGHIREKYEELKLYQPPKIDLSILQEREKID